MAKNTNKSVLVQYWPVIVTFIGIIFSAGILYNKVDIIQTLVEKILTHQTTDRINIKVIQDRLAWMTKVNALSEQLSALHAMASDLASGRVTGIVGKITHSKNGLTMMDFGKISEKGNITYSAEITPKTRIQSISGKNLKLNQIKLGAFAIVDFHKLSPAELAAIKEAYSKLHKQVIELKHYSNIGKLPPTKLAEFTQQLKAAKPVILALSIKLTHTAKP